MKNDETSIFICEDTPDTLADLREDLGEEYPQANIITAETIFEAEQCIANAQRHKLRFIVAILDLMLPMQQKGGQAQYALDLGRKVTDMWSETVVFYITSHVNDVHIQSFMLQVENPRSMRPIFIFKKGNWRAELYKWIRQIVHGQRISRALDRTFVHTGPSPSSNFATFSKSDPSPIGSADATQEVAGIARDISEHWPFLDQELKKRIEEIFNVFDRGDEVEVSLF